MLFEDYISYIAKTFGRKDLAVETDKKGNQFCRLELTSETDIVLTDFSLYGLVKIVGNIGPMPTEHRKGIYRNLLEANFMYKDTHGAVLSVDLETRQITLCDYVHLDSAYLSQLEVKLGYFASDTLRLHEWMSNYVPEEDGAEDAYNEEVPSMAGESPEKTPWPTEMA